MKFEDGEPNLNMAATYRRGLMLFPTGVHDVTIDKSLRRAGRLKRSRNVLKRAERIAQLEYEERWQEGQSPFGLPKVRVVKTTVGKKKKKKAKSEEEAEAEKAS